MKKFSLTSLVILIFGTFIVTSAQSEAREKPRLIDFGASLKPDYSKPKVLVDEKSSAARSDDSEIIRIDTDLVVSDVLVVNEKGFAVSNLTKADFVISEDGIAQTAETFAQGDSSQVGRSIVLVMDYSGSLRPYIHTSVAAAKVLVDKLNPKDKMAIVTDDVELITEFTRDKNLLKAKLDVLESFATAKKFGRSEQFSALYAALNELFDSEDVRPIVIFQTDGDEYTFLKGNFQQRPEEFARLSNLPPTAQALISERTFSYQDVVTAAEKARATIYSIIPGRRFLGLSPEEQTAQARLTQDDRVRATGATDFMRRLSKEAIERNVNFHARWMPRIHKSVASVAITSGGWAEYLETPDKADSVYTKVLNDINNRYLVGYYPANQTRDGKRRTVKIEVHDHPEYQIFTRRSYYAPENH